MTKVTNFLSIALLVSLFAVVPAFGMEGGAAAAPVVPAVSFVDNVAGKVDTLLNGADYLNPFEYIKARDFGKNHSTLVRTAVYASVVALVVTNSGVQSAANGLVDAVKNALGMNDEEADEATEPTRLVIGRQA